MNYDGSENDGLEPERVVVGFCCFAFFCVVDGERGNDYYVFCVSLTQKMNMMFALVGSMKSRCFEVIKIQNCVQGEASLRMTCDSFTRCVETTLELVRYHSINLSNTAEL